MKETKGKDLEVRVKDKDEGRRPKENGSSVTKDHGSSLGSKRRRSESSQSPTESRARREIEHSTEEVGLM